MINAPYSTLLNA